MQTLTIDNVQQGYIDLCHTILMHGEPVAPRGVPTIELEAFTLKLTDPRNCIVAGNGRNANLAIGVAEACQLIGGFSDPNLMVKLSPRFKDFMDNDEFYGAYGPRVRGQLSAVCRALRADPSSRRARVSVWAPNDVMVDGKHDYPCTLGFTFLIRHGKLNMHTHMRSNDAWWGFTYDVMQFCLLQLTMANMLNVPVGSYFHHVDSMHLYERDIDAVGKLSCDGRPAPHSFAGGLHASSWTSLTDLCMKILRGKNIISGGSTANWLSQTIGAKL